MAETKLETKLETKSRVAETAEIGDTVFWYPDANEQQRPFPAIVTGVGISGLCLHVLSQELRNFMVKDGVRHINDPAAKSVELQEAGCWRHRDSTRKVRELLS